MLYRLKEFDAEQKWRDDLWQVEVDKGVVSHGNQIQVKNWLKAREHDQNLAEGVEINNRVKEMKVKEEIKKNDDKKFNKAVQEAMLEEAHKKKILNSYEKTAN